MKAMLKVLFTALLLVGAPAFAAKDVKGGKVIITPAKDDKFKVNEYEFAKAQLYGYLGDLRDSQGLKTVVFKKADKASEEQLRSISSIARHLEIEAVDSKGNNLIRPATVEAPAEAKPAE